MLVQEAHCKAEQDEDRLVRDIEVLLLQSTSKESTDARAGLMAALQGASKLVAKSSGSGNLETAEIDAFTTTLSAMITKLGAASDAPSMQTP